MPTGLIIEADTEFRDRLRDCVTSVGMRALMAVTAVELTSALAKGGIDLIVFGMGPEDSQATVKLAAGTKRCFPRVEVVLISRQRLPRFSPKIPVLASFCGFDEQFALHLFGSCLRQFVERHRQFNELVYVAGLLETTPDVVRSPDALSGFPVICVSLEGKALITTPAAEEALRPVSDPRLLAASESVDPELMQMLRDAASQDEVPVEVMLPMRDCMTSQCQVVLQRVPFNGEQAILALVRELGGDARADIDSLWFGLLEEAAGA